MATFVDIQGFKGNGDKFIIKEIAVYHLGVLSKHVFKPPYKFSKLKNKYKKQAHWLSQNYHGLYWNDGTIPYSRVKEIIYKDLVTNINHRDFIIFVKGDLKVKWLLDYCEVFTVENFESEYDCPRLKDMQDIPSEYTMQNISFAQKNVLNLFALGYCMSAQSELEELLENVSSLITTQNVVDEHNDSKMNPYIPLFGQLKPNCCWYSQQEHRQSQQEQEPEQRI